MSKISMLYREAAPPPEISHLAMSFWEFTVEGESAEPTIHEIFPDGCFSLIYHRNKNFKLDTLFIPPVTFETTKAPVFGGDVFWAIRLLPSAAAKILGQNPWDFQLDILSDSENLKHLSGGVLENFTACESFDEAIEIFTAQIEKLNLKPADTDEKVAEAVRLIEENHGEIKISAIADAVNLSARQLERRFKKNSGLSPKQYARTRRIRATAVAVVEKLQINWANHAAEMGFTDQSHLTREFSSITGRSPNSFAENIKTIEHGEIVK
jgi:AraC-like DNA-binding protein